MKKIKVKEANQNTSAIQVFGMLLIIFAVVDFATSWMGINLTGFMGQTSRFTPIIFGLMGSALMNMGRKDDG
tara:strand:+ start:663 stop:878 length:216 start_codon:yes stop_codon:yes gene_type:complete